VFTHKKRELSTSKYLISQYWLASHMFPTSATKGKFCLWRQAEA